jgi:hypothetical protein
MIIWHGISAALLLAGCKSETPAQVTERNYAAQAKTITTTDGRKMLIMPGSANGGDTFVHRQ